MKFDKKNLLLSVGALVVLVSANVIAQSIYSKNKIGTDKQSLLAAGTIGTITLYVLMSQAKK